MNKISVRQKNIYKTIALILLLCIAAVFYFAPKPLKDVLKLENYNEDFSIFCDVLDMTNKTTGSVATSDTRQLLSFFDTVKVSGPVFYKNAVVNGDIVLLILAIPDRDGYQSVNIELIVENGEKVFLNIGEKGYWIVDGDDEIVKLMETVRGKMHDN